MLTPAVKTAAVPTPAELCAHPSSPWTIDDNGNYEQPTMIEQINRDTIEVEEKLVALIDSGLLDAACRTLVAEGVWTDELYPTRVMLLLVCAARGFRSENALARRLEPQRNLPSLWDWLDEQWHRAYGAHLAARAPNRDELRAFRTRVVASGAVRWLLEDFQDGSLGLAHQMGALTWQPREDLTDVHAYNLLIGDGTITNRYSSIDEVTVDGQTHPYGSRAKDTSRAKVQRRTSDNSQDGKASLYGLNTTHIGTLTYAGYLLLGIDHVEASEGALALDLIESLLGKLSPGRVHGVVYDKAITGWMVDYLLGVYGTPVIGKATASNLKKRAAPPHVKAARKKAKAAADRELAAHAQRRGRQRRQLGRVERREIADAAMTAAMEDLASIGQQPGLTIHRTSRQVPIIIHSAHVELGTATHPTPAGVCSHRLVVDDNALAVLDEHGAKAHQPQVVRSRAEGGENGYALTATWLLPCPHGDFEHTERWTPPTARRARTAAERSCDRHQDPDGERRRGALSRLRLIPQHDPRWRIIAGLRNNTESWHANYKVLLPNKRATSPDADQQLLQYLAAGLLYNAERWERHRRYQEHLARRAGA